MTYQANQSEDVSLKTAGTVPVERVAQIIEELACGWDDCTFDVPAGWIEIGDAIRAHGADLLALATPALPPQAKAEPAGVSDEAKDAARYRWLRSHCRGERHASEMRQRFILATVKPVGNIMQGSVAQHFDAAVDAAINSEQPARAILSAAPSTGVREDDGVNLEANPQTLEASSPSSGVKACSCGPKGHRPTNPLCPQNDIAGVATPDGSPR